MTALSFTGWHKASYSKDGGCVEIGYCGNLRGIRDSKLVDSPVIALSAGTFKALTDALRVGELRG